VTNDEYQVLLRSANNAVLYSFSNNEHKNGAGFYDKGVNHELLKLKGHLHSHKYLDQDNEEDLCLHLTSVAARALKALQLYLIEHPEFIEKYNKVIESE